MQHFPSLTTNHNHASDKIDQKLSKLRVLDLSYSPISNRVGAMRWCLLGADCPVIHRAHLVCPFSLIFYRIAISCTASHQIGYQPLISVDPNLTFATSETIAHDPWMTTNKNYWWLPWLVCGVKVTTTVLINYASRL